MKIRNPKDIISEALVTWQKIACMPLLLGIFYNRNLLRIVLFQREGGGNLISFQLDASSWQTSCQYGQPTVRLLPIPLLGIGHVVNALRIKASIEVF
jgi:hypothetical protein